MGQMVSCHLKRGQTASCIDIDQLLPDDVILEILTRLTVKSLIRARTVCKKWYTLIKNPSFVTKHFNHHTNNSGRLFVYEFDKFSKKYFFSLYPDETLAGSPPVYEDVVVDMPDSLGIRLCNGILCLWNQSNCFALWNPATKEFRSLGVLHINFPPNVVVYEETFGFGWDPITNDYKVVWIGDTADEVRHLVCGRRVAVYTLSTDSWRYLDDVALREYRVVNPPSNTCINGVYHWIAEDCDHKYVILSFDMGNELFHEMHDIPSSEHAVVLAPYNNSLALIYYDPCFHSHPIVDIWVMMEEGCWTKQSTVQILRVAGFPRGFWKNGQLIMKTHNDCHVALYDLQTRKIKELGSRILVKPLVYKESLVAIKGGDGYLEHDQLSDVDQVFNFSSCSP